MTFSTTLETTQDIATLKLTGELDANAASIFREEVEKAVANHPKRLVLMMQDLEYMASAGLRVLIYTKQKVGANVDIYIVGTQEMVRDTLAKTGFAMSVYMVDCYEEANGESH